MQIFAPHFGQKAIGFLHRAAALRAEAGCFLLAYPPAVGEHGFQRVIG